MYLTARDITKRWTDRNVLDHIDLTIDQNDRIGLVGANGCGKSTLLSLIARLLTPESGKILFPMLEKDESPKIGYMLQVTKVN